MDPRALLHDPSDVTSLLRSPLKPATRRRYRQGAARFRRWLAGDGSPVDTLAQLDEAFYNFIVWHVRKHGARYKSRVVHALYGVQHCVVGAPKHMPLSTRALINWGKNSPSRSWPPFTWPVVLAVAAAMAVRGKRSMALLTLLSFHCLLRIGEAVNLRVFDFANADDPRMDAAFSKQAAAALRFRDTKTGPNQFVTLMDRELAAILAKRVEHRRPAGVKAKIFAFSASTYRRELKAVCGILGLKGYVPHSLRHGGATHLKLVLGWSVEDVMERGRWMSSTSARRYIQQGRAIMLMCHVPLDVKRRGESFAQAGLSVIFAT